MSEYDEARRAAHAARYGELTDTYTWNLVADAVLAAAVPLIAAGERERIAELATTQAAGMRASNFAEHEAICAAALEDFAAELRGEQP